VSELEVGNASHLHYSRILSRRSHKSRIGGNARPTRQGVCAVLIEFEVPFLVAPPVTVALAGMDAEAGRHRSVDTWVTDCKERRFWLQSCCERPCRTSDKRFYVLCVLYNLSTVTVVRQTWVTM
jgi:hypothetical protein